MAKDKYDIDIHRLHLEWQRQPKLFHEAADRLAEAREEMDRLKGRLELISAKVATNVRESPSLFGLKKVTEDSVKTAVTMSEPYQTALAKYNAARSEAGHAQAAVDYLDHRKTAIEYLSRLRLADYFSDPRIPAGARAREEEELLERTRAE